MTIWQMSYTLEDAYNRKSTRQVEIEAVDYTTARAAGSAFLTDLAALTEAKILKSSVGQIVPYTDTVDAGANMDAGVTFVWEIGGVPGKLGNTKVPAPVLTIFDVNGNADLTDAIVTAYAANFLGGDIVISDGEAVDALKSGKLDR